MHYMNNAPPQYYGAHNNNAQHWNMNAGYGYGGGNNNNNSAQHREFMQNEFIGQQNAPQTIGQAQMLLQGLNSKKKALARGQKAVKGYLSETQKRFGNNQWQQRANKDVTMFLNKFDVCKSNSLSLPSLTEVSYSQEQKSHEDIGSGHKSHEDSPIINIIPQLLVTKDISIGKSVPSAPKLSDFESSDISKNARSSLSLSE